MRFDARYGTGAFNQDPAESVQLAQSMLAAGEASGKQTTAFVVRTAAYSVLYCTVLYCTVATDATATNAGQLPSVRVHCLLLCNTEQL